MFLHTFHPSPTLINFGSFSIQWYGFLITLAIIVSFFIAHRLFKKYKLSLNLFYDLSFYLLIFGLIGARLWHVLSELNYYIENPLDIIKIWNGGLGIFGAVIAGVIVILVYSYIKSIPTPFRGEGSRKQRGLRRVPSTPRLIGGSLGTGLMPMARLLDIFAPLVVLGLAFGRWGNYFNQELYGWPTQAWRGIPIDFIHRLPGYEQFEFFHPTFLYESLFCLILFGVLMYLHKLRVKPGYIFLSFLILYSIQRFLIGFIRLDPMIGWLGLRLDQWMSLVFILVSLLFIFKLKNGKIKVGNNSL